MRGSHINPSNPDQSSPQVAATSGKETFSSQSRSQHLQNSSTKCAPKQYRQPAVLDTEPETVQSLSLTQNKQQDIRATDSLSFSSDSLASQSESQPQLVQTHLSSTGRGSTHAESSVCCDGTTLNVEQASQAVETDLAAKAQQDTPEPTTGAASVISAAKKTATHAGSSACCSNTAVNSEQLSQAAETIRLEAGQQYMLFVIDGTWQEAKEIFKVLVLCSPNKCLTVSTFCQARSC